MSVNVLRVPVRTDALFVASGSLELARPMADFSSLPYSLADGTVVNSTPPTPNLAEAAFQSPLGGAGGNVFALPAGLHLHWALPDALTTGHARGEHARFPAVPNRWLVRRLDAGGHLQESWIVESDYLHPLDANGLPTVEQPVDGTGKAVTAWPGGKPVTFPVKRVQLSSGNPGVAFRYMGRALTLADWTAGTKAGVDYLNHRTISDYVLTALGYGEPAFAAYYPHCTSVFGFCDVDPILDPHAQYVYEIFGWVQEEDLDPLQAREFADLASDVERYAALETEFAWRVPKGDAGKPFPSRVVCYSSVELRPVEVAPAPPSGASPTSIAVGNTAGEALAALLADRLADGQQGEKEQIEDQLEAFNLASSLQGVEVDYEAHFEHVRHQRGFMGISGGERWAVVPKRGQADSARESNEDDEPPPLLPDAVAHALDALNTDQEAYDRVWQEIKELRYQTFCDWHKFVNALYTSSVSLQPFREDSDSLREFVERESLALLRQKIELAGRLVREDGAWRSEGASAASLDLKGGILSPAQPQDSTLAVQVLFRLRDLIAALAASKGGDAYDLVLRPAESYWRPREPVVLLEGDVAIDSLRHGLDGELDCAVVAMPGAPGSAGFLGALGTLEPPAGDPSWHVHCEAPWHPILLEWSVAATPVESGRTPNPDVAGTLDYEETFLTQNYELPVNRPDLVPKSGAVLGTRNTYEGRCTLTASSGTQLQENLARFLVRTSLATCADPAAEDDEGYRKRLLAWYALEQKSTPPTKAGALKTWMGQARPFVDPAKDATGPPPERLLDVSTIVGWYAKKPVAGSGQRTVADLSAREASRDPVYSAIRGLSLVGGLQVLSQALGGFHAAQMTRRQMLQIPIDDPLDFQQLPAFGNLNRAVAEAVGAHHPFAPRSSKVFCPIQSGRLALESLRLIDTFGQQWDASLAGQRIVNSNTVSDPADAVLTALAPRFTAPARLDFRWLAALSGQAGVDEVEANSVPVTTPVCGWLIPNHLSDSLMVYDDRGRSLGSINTLAEWMPAPGTDDRIAAAEIPNPHLRRLVRRLVVDVGTPSGEASIRQSFLASFLSTLDSAFETIEPASFAQHQALALLMGRPIAVVRAQVDFRLLGQPTETKKTTGPAATGGRAIRLAKSRRWKTFVDQGWDVFAYDWGRFYGCTYEQVLNGSCLFLDEPPELVDYARTTHGFERVVLPLRLGEDHLLNDGLFGFWRERDGELDNVFHAPQTSAGLKLSPDVTYQPGRTTPCIRTREQHDPGHIELTPVDEPEALTLLVDPRGVVHATCGLLPVSKLEIPSVFYAEALSRMGVTFCTSPILTDSQALHLPLPKEPGFAWSWITRADGSTWQETAEIADATEHAHFFRPPTIVEGWLKLAPKEND